MIQCEPGVKIDYQGSGIAFIISPKPFIYEGEGGITGCNITNSTNNWTAAIKWQDAVFQTISNTVIQGRGNGVGLLEDSHIDYTERGKIDHVAIAGVLSPVQLQVTGGSGSFAYQVWTAVHLQPSKPGGACVTLLNNAQLSGSHIQEQCFVPQNGTNLWLRNASSIVLSYLEFFCEAQDGVTSANCLKTEPGTSLQTLYYERTANPGVFRDLLAVGSVLAYTWNYGSSGFSQGQATSNGFAVTPAGTEAGYACGSSCGSLNYDTNTQKDKTFPHIQPPANLGNGTFTYAFSNMSQSWSGDQNDMTLVRPTIGGGTILRRYARYVAHVSPSSIGANTTVEQCFRSILTSGDILISVQKPTHQVGLGIVGWRENGTSACITFSNSGRLPITPSSDEAYQFVAVQ